MDGDVEAAVRAAFAIGLPTPLPAGVVLEDRPPAVVGQSEGVDVGDRALGGMPQSMPKRKRSIPQTV